MRAGKENGLLLPSTNGTAGQFLISQANGNVVWSTVNAVTTDTTQTITGAKTFSNANLYVGAAGSGNTITGLGNSLSLTQTGGTYGPVKLSGMLGM